jgi:lysophospholipase L1-like esterase
VRASVVFRILLALWPLGCLGVLGFLATHRSQIPVVLGRYSRGYFAMLAAIAAISAIGTALQHPRLYRRLHARRIEIVLMLSALAAALTLAEAALRVFDPLGLWTIGESLRHERDFVPDAQLGYALRPGLRATYQGVSVSINELGLRERSVVPKRPDELRVLLLGDSVTFGWGVPIEATFGRRLESTLMTALHRPVTTINAGVGGYNTEQEYVSLLKYYDVVKPDLVTLLYVGNDTQRRAHPFRPLTPPEAFELLLMEKSWVYRLGYFIRMSGASRGPLSDDAPGSQVSMDALAAIAEFCGRRGIPFMTFVYRTPEEASHGVPAVLQRIRDLGEKLAFPVIDTADWWKGATMRVITNSKVDAHPNERGHAILAEGMAATVKSRLASGQAGS